MSPVPGSYPSVVCKLFAVNTGVCTTRTSRGSPALGAPKMSRITCGGGVTRTRVPVLRPLEPVNLVSELMEQLVSLNRAEINPPVVSVLCSHETGAVHKEMRV